MEKNFKKEYMYISIYLYLYIYKLNHFAIQQKLNNTINQLYLKKVN